MKLKVALVAGGMYDHLYGCIPEFERATGTKVEVLFRGNHPELNAHLAGLDEVPYDLVSTHTKYAPSQLRFLAPVEDVDTSDFFPSLLGMATIDGALYGVPRNIDLRLLHYRTDLIDKPPTTWNELVEDARRLTCGERSGFVMPGMDSGLFGTFYELAEAGGAHVFPPSLVPEVNNEGGRWALRVLSELYTSGSVPMAITEWHFDEVHSYFRNGHAAMVFDWPGYYGSYCEATSAVKDHFKVARMPAGPTGKIRCYAGSHTFALTKTGVNKTAARELLRFLTAAEQQKIEARDGSVPARRSIMREEQESARGERKRRLALLSGSIETDLIIPPKLACYPRIEHVLWRTVRSAMVGEMPIELALVELERKIGEIVKDAA